jgi:uncharacterized protein (DUF3084 family)
MFWTILALCSLVVLSGFIAYYGDLQGRRWGKRRVSWLGLRPKHTAIVVTTLNGVVIASLSIITVLAAVPPIRHIILKGEKAVRENNQLVMKLQRERMFYEDKVREDRNQSELALAQIGELRAQISTITLREGELKRRIPELLKRKDALIGQITLDETRIRAQQARIAAAQSQLARVEANARQLAAQNMQVNRANIALTRSNAKLERGNSNLARARDSLISDNNKLDHANRALTESTNQLNASISELERQQEEKQRDLADKSEQLKKVTDAYDVAVSNEITLEREVNATAKSLVAVRAGKFSLRAGAELARRTLDAHLRPEAVRRELELLLDAASAAALSHGAVEGDNHRAVRIATRRIVTLAGTEYADESACLATLEEKLYAGDTPIVVIANAVTNSVEGEQVLIDLTPYAVKPIFERGAKLASIEVNGRQSADALFDQLVQFLNSGVRSAALKAGAIPRTDPETGEQRLGDLNLHDVLRLTDRIKRMRGQVVITAVAAEAATCADPLRLRFDLSRPVVAETPSDDRSR